MIETLRENAKAEAIQDIPGIANSLNWAADEIERLRGALGSIEVIAGPNPYTSCDSCASVTRLVGAVLSDLSEKGETQ